MDKPGSQIWGFVDKSGSVVIKPKYFAVGSFKNGVAMVFGADGKRQFIDSHGQRVANPNPASLYAKRVGQKYGFENDSGELKLPAIWDHASDFEEGVALVGNRPKKLHDGQDFLIDERGNVIYDFPNMSPHFGFENGLLEVFSVEGSGLRYGFIDRSGKFALQPVFGRIVHFSEGLVGASPLPPGESKWRLQKEGYADKSGTFVIAPRFDWTSAFSEGLAYVEENNRKEFIDKAGEVVFSLPKTASGVGDFHEGLASVCVGGEGERSIFPAKDSRVGFVDRSGRMCIPPSFSSSCLARPNFSEGLAPVAVAGERIGFIDKTGIFVIKPRFVDARAFCEGLAAVAFDRNLEVANKTGLFDDQLTEEQYWKSVMNIIGMAAAPFADVRPVRLFVEIKQKSDASLISFMQLESGPSEAKNIEALKLAILKAHLPNYPSYLGVFNKKTLSLVTTKTDTVLQKSQSDPAKDLLSEEAKLSSEYKFVSESETSDPHKCIELLNQALTIRASIYNFGDYNVFHYLSDLRQLSIQIGDYALAERFIRMNLEVAKLSPATFWTSGTTNYAIPPAGVEGLLRELVSTLLHQNKESEALQVEEQLTKLDSREAHESEADLGELFYKRGDYEKSEKFFKMALGLALAKVNSPKGDIDKDSWVADYLQDLDVLSQFHASLNRWQEAETCFKTLLFEVKSKYSDCLYEHFEWFSSYYEHLIATGRQHDAADLDKERLALRRSSDQYFLIDRSGKRLNNLPLDDIRSFEEGLSPAKFFGRWGYIDLNGKPIIPFTLQYAGAFSEGLAPVACRAKKFPECLHEQIGNYGFIDKTGTFKIAPTFYSAASFSEGLAAVRTTPDWNHSVA